MNTMNEVRPVPKPSDKPKSRSPKRKKPDALYTKALRERIKERDQFCQVCGGVGDQVHHVIPRGRYKVHPERYTIAHVHDERNLMWVCGTCHHGITIHNDELERVIVLQEKRFGSLRKEG